MTTIKAFMQDNHRHCDELYATAEEAVADQLEIAFTDFMEFILA